jgi:hypothetical protein
MDSQYIQALPCSPSSGSCRNLSIVVVAGKVPLDTVEHPRRGDGEAAETTAV